MCVHICDRDGEFSILKGGSGRKRNKFKKRKTEGGSGRPKKGGILRKAEAEAEENKKLYS